MKKILSITLAAVMLLSIIPTAFAAENNWQGGTKVEYTATANEQYTVTVPATLAPGGSGDVVASGTWGSNRKLTVTADDDVTLTNSINAADQKVLDVTFAGIELTGSNTESVSDTKQVAVANITDAIFGTWSGTFNYNVAMSDVAGTVRPTPDPDQPSDPDDGGAVKPSEGQILLTIEGVSYLADEDMTWAEWVESDYNTGGYLIAKATQIATGDIYYIVVNASKDARLAYLVGGTTPSGKLEADAKVTNSYPLVLDTSFFEIDQTNLITFTIDGTECQAEEGMTWAEWVESEYNTDGYLIADGTNISNGSTTRLVVNASKEKYINKASGGAQSEALKIQSSVDYELSSERFTIA